MTDIGRAARLVAEAPCDGHDGPSGRALAASLRQGGLLDARLSTGELFDALVALGRANLSAGRIFEGHVNAIKLLDLYGSGERPSGLLGIWGADGPDPVRIENGILRGQKLFASGADVLDHVIVTAMAEDQLLNWKGGSFPWNGKCRECRRPPRGAAIWTGFPRPRLSGLAGPETI